MNTAEVRLSLGAEAARTALAALEPDNDGHLDARVEGDELVLSCSGSVMGVLRTLDDALDCVRALGEPLSKAASVPPAARIALDCVRALGEP